MCFRPGRVCFRLRPLRFSGLDRLFFRFGSLCFRLGPLCVSGLDRNAMCFRLGPLCVSGLDRTVLCFRLGPLCFRLGPLCVSGLDRFSEDLEAMLGHRPGRYWMVCWKFVAPVFLVVSMVTVCSDIWGFSSKVIDQRIFQSNCVTMYCSGSSLLLDTRWVRRLHAASLRKSVWLVRCYHS